MVQRLEILSIAWVKFAAAALGVCVTGALAGGTCAADGLYISEVAANYHAPGKARPMGWLEVVNTGKTATAISNPVVSRITRSAMVDRGEADRLAARRRFAIRCFDYSAWPNFQKSLPKMVNLTRWWEIPPCPSSICTSKASIFC